MSPVDLRLSIVKPLGAQGMIKLYDYLKSKPDIIKNGFRSAGYILQVSFTTCITILVKYMIVYIILLVLV